METLVLMVALKTIKSSFNLTVSVDLMVAKSDLMVEISDLMVSNSFLLSFISSVCTLSVDTTYMAHSFQE